MFFSFSAPNAGQFVIAGRKFAIDALDMRKAAPPFFRGLEKIVDDQFRLGKTLVSGKWAPLTNNPWMDGGRLIRPGYRDWKLGKYADRGGDWWAYRGPKGKYFPNVMSRTGRLHRALTDAGAPGAVRNAERHQYVFGADVRVESGHNYGMFHQAPDIKSDAVTRTLLDPPSGKNVPAAWRRLVRPIQAHILAESNRHLGGFIAQDRQRGSELNARL